MEVKKSVEMVLEPGETVVAMVTFRNYVLVITDKGTIYQITEWDEAY